MYTNSRPPSLVQLQHQTQQQQQQPQPNGGGGGIDAEYDYGGGGGGVTQPVTTTPTPTSASAYGVEQNRSYQQRQRQQQQQHRYPNNNNSSSGGGGGGNHGEDPYNNTRANNTYMSATYEQQQHREIHGDNNDDYDDFAPQQHEQEEEEDVEVEDALLDLAQLEELHLEAERMKMVGNKHMAACEYVPAYNAYSAALQLSPVGPSSHVFLSNRAAALLSLKRYAAAATDAKRAVALAPTFGKAHARLGQALYFSKDYAGAVRAYEDAVSYEPDNPVTVAYLEKALQKLERAEKKQQHATTTLGGGGDGTASVLTAETSSARTLQNSIATDPFAQHTLVQRPYHHSHDNNSSNNNNNTLSSTTDEDANQGSTTRAAMLRAITSATSAAPPTPSAASASAKQQEQRASSAYPSSQQQQQQQQNHPSNESDDDDDPEFSEAVRIQQRANRFLVQKQYRAAIEEYTAALFLVPDDVNLSPDLHLGRAHALNGSRRHESARNDAVLALKLQPDSAAAYSTLAKSLFYLKDYQGAVDAFGKCHQLLPKGESLGMFDQAYLEKAERGLLEEAASLGLAGKPSPKKGGNISTSCGGNNSISGNGVCVPKLPPPRFVPREDAILQQQQSASAASTPRSMPKEWPQQSPRESRTPLKCGPERHVVCLTEGLGIKLNRGSDGIVRVLKVSDCDHDDGGAAAAAAMVMRRGEILAGDVVREIAGVDIRRPITNIMWGDTVALIKMAPRPITIAVAPELSPVPTQVLDEMKRAAGTATTTAGEPQQRMERPSRASDENAVVAPIGGGPPHTEGENSGAAAAVFEDALAVTEDEVAPSDDGSFATAAGEEEVEVTAPDPELLSFEEDEEPEQPMEDEVSAPLQKAEEPSVSEALAAAAAVSKIDEEDDDDDIVEVDNDVAPAEPIAPKVSASPTLDTVAETADDDKSTQASSVDVGADAIEEEDDDDGIESVEDESSPTSSSQRKPLREKKHVDKDVSFEMASTSLRDEEEKVVGGEILFLRDSPPTYGGWDTLRWMSHNGARKVNFCQQVYRLTDGAKKRIGLPLFWKTGGKHYEERAMVVYDEPKLILIVRRPANLEEIRNLLGLPDVSHETDTSTDTDWALNPDTAMQSYWILESVADPASSKLRLSPLTTATSVAAEGADDRKRSCFQILTPTETIILSAVNVRSEAKRREQSFTDSGAFLETLSVEASIAQAICGAHSNGGDLGNSDTDIAWKHQIIIGSLHSLVLSGNPKLLNDGVIHARSTASRGGKERNADTKFLPSRIVDAVDDNGFSALYYACSHKMDSAIRTLVDAGADVNFRTEVHGLSMIHLSARNLDDRSLSTLLSATSPARPDANSLDKKGRTPMYVAMVEGSVLDNGKDPAALGRCISALGAWGGSMMAPRAPEKLRNPVSALAYMWLPEYLSVVLDHISYRFPLETKGTDPVTMSLGALYQYPVHSALIALRKHLRRSAKVSGIESTLIRTLRVLFEHGFEPNERLDARAFGAEKTSFDEFVGYAPMQIVALLALEFDATKGDLDGAIFVGSMKVIGDVAEFLLRNGGRLSLEPPPATRLRSKVANVLADVTEGASRRIEILTQKLDADKQLLVLIGGEERLNIARKEWAEMKKVATTRTKNLVEDSAIENWGAAGGSDSLSCAICWSVFGTLINRKHKCRVTNRYVCDECSAKRLIQVTSEYRLSDGQFLLARVDAVTEQNERSSASNEKERSKSIQSEQARVAVRFDRLEAEEQTNRDSLFGGMLEAATSFVLGEESPSSSSQTIGGLTASLDQTRDALHQRGEQLASLNDKSTKMVDASSDFAKMATELRKQSEKGLFW